MSKVNIQITPVAPESFIKLNTAITIRVGKLNIKHHHRFSR